MKKVKKSSKMKAKTKNMPKEMSRGVNFKKSLKREGLQK